MKQSLVFLLIAFFVLSCQNESKNLQISWVKEIDKSTAEFDKTEELDDYTIGNDSLGLIRTVMYKKDKNGLFKIVDEVYHDKLMSHRRVFYIRNDQLIKTELLGFSTHIKKGPKNASKSYCELFKEVIYFKSASEGLKFEKRLQAADCEDLDKKIKEFETLNWNEEPSTNLEEEYIKLSNTIEELKMKIESQR